MEIAKLIVQLDELRERQSLTDTAWKKKGNREFLAFMTELLPLALSAERCSIFISNPDDDNVWIQCGTGIKEKQIMVPTENSLVGEVIATGRRIIDNQLEKRIGIHDLIALKTGYTAYNALCVPIYGHLTHRVAGAIQLLNKLPKQSEFTIEDARLVEKLARHMHINVENIFLNQEMASATIEIGKKIVKIEEQLFKHGAPL